MGLAQAKKKRLLTAIPIIPFFTKPSRVMIPDTHSIYLFRFLGYPISKGQLLIQYDTKQFGLTLGLFLLAI